MQNGLSHAKKSSIYNREIEVKQAIKKTPYIPILSLKHSSQCIHRNCTLLSVLKTLVENQVLLIDETPKLALEPEPNSLQQL